MAAHRYVLTGTPAPNSPADLKVMFDLVWTGQGQALVRHPQRNRCFVRATNSMLGLPPMRTHIERVPLSVAHEALYGAAVRGGGGHGARPGHPGCLAQIGRIVMLLLPWRRTPPPCSIPPRRYA